MFILCFDLQIIVTLKNVLLEKTEEYLIANVNKIIGRIFRETASHCRGYVTVMLTVSTVQMKKIASALMGNSNAVFVNMLVEDVKVPCETSFHSALLRIKSGTEFMTVSARKMNCKKSYVLVCSQPVFMN